MPEVVGHRLDREPHELEPGEYGKHEGHWFGHPPDTSLLCRLDGHQIVEHADGSITASPSILITGPGKLRWHGYLKAGRWLALPDCSNKVE